MRKTHKGVEESIFEVITGGKLQRDVSYFVQQDYNKNSPFPANEKTVMAPRCDRYFIAIMDGIKINTDMNAVDKDGNPIEGCTSQATAQAVIFMAAMWNLLAGTAAGRSTTVD